MITLSLYTAIRLSLLDIWIVYSKFGVIRELEVGITDASTVAFL